MRKPDPVVFSPKSRLLSSPPHLGSRRLSTRSREPPPSNNIVFGVSRSCREDCISTKGRREEEEQRTKEEGLEMDASGYRRAAAGARLGFS